jgi:putative transposase
MKYNSEFPVLKMCQVLNVSRSGYYDWYSREPSARCIKRKELLEKIKESHQNSYESYGSPRIYQDLIDEGAENIYL